MFTKKFLTDLAERVIASAAGGALAAVAVGVTAPEKIAGAAGIAALVSLLKGLVASRVADPTSASLVE